MARPEAVIVALCVLLAAGLVAAALTTRASARSSLSAADRGQGTVLLQAVRQGTRPGSPWDADTLERLVQRHATDGLRCVAVLLPGARLLGSAGTCPERAVLEAELPRQRPDQVLTVGNRVRMVDAPPPGRGRPGAGGRFGPPPWMSPTASAPGDEPRGPADRRERPPDGGDRRDGPPAGTDRREGPPPGDDGGQPREPPLGGPGGGGPPLVMVEFEPLLTRNLDTAVRRSVTLAVAASVTLAAAALLLWRLSQRAARASGQLAAQSQLAALGEMSLVLAHEIRNPLASMKGHAQLLAEQLPRDSPQHTKAGRLVTEAMRLERLCSDLLGFASAGRPTLSTVDPVSPLRDAIEDTGGAAAIDAASAPPQWRMDGDHVRQALANLLSNAAQASPAPGSVSASVASERGHLLYRVLDRGAGVPPAEREAIFAPFHTTRARGTGLGLAIARRVVEAHGGTITVADRAGGGAVFTVSLPPGER